LRSRDSRDETRLGEGGRLEPFKLSITEEWGARGALVLTGEGGGEISRSGRGVGGRGGCGGMGLFAREAKAEHLFRSAGLGGRGIV